MKIKGNFMREKFSYDKYLDFIEKDELEEKIDSNNESSTTSK